MVSCLKLHNMLIAGTDTIWIFGLVLDMAVGVIVGQIRSDQ